MHFLVTNFAFLLAKEEEKNKLLKRSEELKAERVQLEAKAKQLSNAIMVRCNVKGIMKNDVHVLPC